MLQSEVVAQLEQATGQVAKAELHVITVYGIDTVLNGVIGFIGLEEQVDGHAYVGFKAELLGIREEVLGADTTENAENTVRVGGFLAARAE